MAAEDVGAQICDMALTGRSHVDWLSFPPEFWGYIFSRLQPVNKNIIDKKSLSNFSVAPFYELSLVCKAFNQIFWTDLKLHTGLCLNKRQGISSLASLVTWLCKDQARIHTLVIDCDQEWQPATLAVLLGAFVTTIRLANASIPALEMLTQFQNITQCVISVSRATNLGLPLKALPNLASLTLDDGDFTGVEHAVSLTSLTLRESCISCSGPCTFRTSLLELQLKSSTLCVYHGHGLGEFCRLQYLRCIQSLVGGIDTEFFDLRDEVIPPPTMSLLTALTKLEFKTQYKGYFELDWITHLQGLKSVSAHVVADEIELSEDISTMVNLQSLQVLCDTRYGRVSALYVSLDWTSLVSLESLVLSSATIVMHSVCLDGLLSLEHLKYCMYSCNGSRETKQQLTELSQKMFSSRPDIDFNIRVWDPTEP